ncbi:MAG: hypothetical protein Q8M02_02465 [Candidatus Didemnitutus sp.]|nr:hypothetical protein [Candidatus Didemnitutus sp.]
MKTKLIFLSFVLLAISAASARADLLDNVTIDIRLGRRAPPPPPAVVIVVQENDSHGPHQWEHRGHWYQRSRAYYYYPGDDVYYRQSDQMWFYLERGQWRSNRNLPDFVRIDFGRSVTVNMFTDRPYTYHEKVVGRYPSNYFGTRVRLQHEDKHDNRRDVHPQNKNHDERDSDGDGRDKDKDKNKDKKKHDNRK